MPSLWLIPLKSVFPLIWFFYFPPLFSWKTIQESVFYGSPHNPSPPFFLSLGISDLDHISNWCRGLADQQCVHMKYSLRCLWFKCDPVGLIYFHTRLAHVLPVTQPRSSFKQFFTNGIVCIGLKPCSFFIVSVWVNFPLSSLSTHMWMTHIQQYVKLLSALTVNGIC